MRPNPVTHCNPDAGEFAALSYRSKKELEGDVRIIRFPGADATQIADYFQNFFSLSL